MEDFLTGFQHRFHELVELFFFSPLPLSFIKLSEVFFFPSPFVDVLFVYALECVVITSLVIFCCFHVMPDLSQLSFYTFDLFYI